MISIVLITCNRQDELQSAILSCLRKSAEAIEIIVVDNQSTDQTRSMLENLSAAHGFPLKFIFNAENKGVAESRNQGYRAAKGDIVFFLDDDAVVVTEENCIEKAAAFMRANPAYAVLATEIFNVRNDRFQLGAFPRKTPERTEGEVFNFIGASHFINKFSLQLPYLYPKEFVYGGEELYLSILIKKMGLQVYYYKGILVNHITSVKTRMSTEDIAIKNYSNFFNVKRYFAPILFLPAIWIVMIVRLFLLSKLRWPVIRKMYVQVKNTYNRKYRNPLSVRAYAGDIQKYGTRTIL